MDKPRSSPRKKRRPLYIGGGIALLALLTAGLSQLKPAPPSVDGAAIYTDTVRRGELVRQVRGPGTLTPEHIRILPAITAGRVDEILARPGTVVEPGTLLLRLSNPEVELSLLESERQLAQARTETVSLQASLRTQILQLESAVAQAQSQYNEAVRQANTSAELATRGLIAPNEASRAQDQVEEARTRLDIEKQRLELARGTVDAQLETQQLQVERLSSLVAMRRQQLESMDVRAGTAGVLQQLNLEVGQWVNPGMELARVVEPGRLKAVLRIPDTQMRDVVIGQVAFIDTRNDTIRGRVVRIDPAAQGGTTGVDVALDGELPASARPDMSIDGTIEIDRLDDVLFVSRPNYGSAGQAISLFVVSADGRTADRVQVRLGQTSVNFVEIVSGLNQGDRVILSDMQQWDAHNRVRIR
ncbi:MAG TPA: HlyD family efflux transporter periplasmic adaptor subunit [Longimicrobiales bacterium]|nr:HlyD family efflux transporter periplasmic adaptor subunit [Longimicrobiales bacterium]